MILYSPEQGVVVARFDLSQNAPSHELLTQVSMQATWTEIVGPGGVVRSAEIRSMEQLEDLFDMFDQLGAS